jgi:hypothetical protein
MKSVLFMGKAARFLKTSFSGVKGKEGDVLKKWK